MSGQREWSYYKTSIVRVGFDGWCGEEKLDRSGSGLTNFLVVLAGTSTRLCMDDQSVH